MKGCSGLSARARCARTRSSRIMLRISSSESKYRVLSSCDVRKPSKKCRKGTRDFSVAAWAISAESWASCTEPDASMAKPALRTAITSHLNDRRNVAPNIANPRGSPFICQLRHRRRRRDRVDRADFVHTVGHVCNCRVAVHRRLRCHHQLASDPKLRGLLHHLHRMAGTLLDANRAAGTAREVDPITKSGPQLDDRLLGTRRVTVVTLEAVSAGEAPPGFVQCLGLTEAGDYFLKTLHPFFRRALAFKRRKGIGVNGQFQH